MKIKVQQFRHGQLMILSPKHPLYYFALGDQYRSSYINHKQLFKKNGGKNTIKPQIKNIDLISSIYSVLKEIAKLRCFLRLKLYH